MTIVGKEGGAMKVFLDTEFTNLENPELISIGMITEDGEHQLYLEVSDFPLLACSDFVIETVFPLFGDGKSVKAAELRDELNCWFASLPDEITICCDSQYDKALLVRVFEGRLPVNLINWIDLYPFRSHPDFQRAIVNYHIQVRKEHHALHDAIAMQQGWLAIEGRVW